MPAMALELYFFNTPGLHVADGSGEYDKLVKKAKYSDVKIQYYPVKRALDHFKKCDKCCLSPVNKDAEFFSFQGESYIQSKTMGVAKVYLFSRPGLAELKDLKTLKGKTIGAKRGLNYGKSIEESGVVLDRVNKLVQNVQKAQNKRIDYFVAYAPDIFTIFKDLQIKPFPYAKDNPIAIHHDRIVCKKSDETVKFIEMLDEVID
jgi:ABC-type amino acid transport substrate-binding protein